MCNKVLEQAFEDIVRKRMQIPTLTRRNSDTLDFHEVSVWGLQDALLAAYTLGLREGLIGDTPGDTMPQ